MKNRWLCRVLGEGEGAMPPPPPSPEEDTIPSEAQPVEDEGQGGNVEDIPSSDAVNMLVQAWQSGSRNDVAAQLLFTPVSYADFVRMCFRIGQADAVQLGDLLDNLAEESGLVTDVPGQNKILARVTGQEEPSGEQITDEETDVLPVPPGKTP